MVLGLELWLLFDELTRSWRGGGLAGHLPLPPGLIWLVTNVSRSDLDDVVVVAFV